jgi:putative solute:sodium symporter small subunit
MSQKGKSTDTSVPIRQEDSADQVYHHDEAENLPAHSHHDNEVLSEANLQAYWRANIKVLVALLSLWAFVSLICGIVLGDWLDQFYLGGFPLGFWFTQQGAMLCFVAIIFIYHFWMLRIERRYGVDDDNDDSGDLINKSTEPSTQQEN